MASTDPIAAARAALQSALDALTVALAAPPPPLLAPEQRRAECLDAEDPIVQAALGFFYEEVQHALGVWMSKGRAKVGGAVTVVKRVAVENGVQRAAVVPLPRLSRAEEGEAGFGQPNPPKSAAWRSGGAR
jgi:hypothetical protein